MRIDLHVHLADIERFLAVGSVGTKSLGWPLSRVIRQTRAELANAEASAGDHTVRWIHKVAAWVRESGVDRAVALALDGVFQESGASCPQQTVLRVDNDFVCDAVTRHREFLFGASVHPYRKDALPELERLIRKGACLIKWIPSAQRIEPDNPRCLAFYEVMAHYGIPLLSHTGVEHALGRQRADYNHPRRLIPALERGVRVIAAHCGTRLFLHETSHFKAWADLAAKYDGFYGDSGAFPVVTRVPALWRILSDSVLRDKIIYGSDFPGIPAPGWCWQLGLSKIRQVSHLENPLSRNVSVMQALGLPEEAFTRAHRLLNIGRKEGR